MRNVRLGLSSACLVLLTASTAAAQYPQQPYPQQQPYYPQPQQQPYYPQPQPQPYYPQPQQQQPYYPQPQGYQPYPQQQPYYPQPQQQVQTQRRGAGEMGALYVTGAIYGIGTGIWLDALGKIDNPGPAVVMPILFGAGVPIGLWAWDRGVGGLHRGVPASIAAGLVLGGVEGIAINGVQWQYTRERNNDWSFQTQTTVTWIMATAGGVGGWAFGEWLRPDPRGLTFTVSAAGMGAVSGSLIGIASQNRHQDWKDGASVAGIIGYNIGIVGGAALSIVHTPSYYSQKWMWIGYAGGAVAGSLVFPFYLALDNPNYKSGLIGPALGSIAGAALAGALTFDSKDNGQATYKPPVDLNVGAIPPLTPVSAQNTASGRAVANLVGNDPRFTTSPPGGMITLGKEF